MTTFLFEKPRLLEEEVSVRQGLFSPKRYAILFDGLFALYKSATDSRPVALAPSACLVSVSSSGNKVLLTFEGETQSFSPTIEFSSAESTTKWISALKACILPPALRARKLLPYRSLLEGKFWVDQIINIAMASTSDSTATSPATFDSTTPLTLSRHQTPLPSGPSLDRSSVGSASGYSTPAAVGDRSSRHIIMQGTLKKKSPREFLGFQPWQSRIFVLYPDVLLYYRGSEDTPAGAITIAEISDVILHPTDPILELVLSHPMVASAAATQLSKAEATQKAIAAGTSPVCVIGDTAVFDTAAVDAANKSKFSLQLPDASESKSSTSSPCMSTSRSLSGNVSEHGSVIPEPIGDTKTDGTGLQSDQLSTYPPSSTGDDASKVSSSGQQDLTQISSQSTLTSDRTRPYLAATTTNLSRFASALEKLQFMSHPAGLSTGVTEPSTPEGAVRTVPLMAPTREKIISWHDRIQEVRAKLHDVQTSKFLALREAQLQALQAHQSATTLALVDEAMESPDNSSGITFPLPPPPPPPADELLNEVQPPPPDDAIYPPPPPPPDSPPLFTPSSMPLPPPGTPPPLALIDGDPLASGPVSQIQPAGQVGPGSNPELVSEDATPGVPSEPLSQTSEETLAPPDAQEAASEEVQELSVEVDQQEASKELPMEDPLSLEPDEPSSEAVDSKEVDPVNSSEEGIEDKDLGAVSSPELTSQEQTAQDLEEASHDRRRSTLAYYGSGTQDLEVDNDCDSDEDDDADDGHDDVQSKMAALLKQDT